MIYIILVSLPRHCKITNAMKKQVSVIRYRRVPKIKVSVVKKKTNGIGASLLTCVFSDWITVG